MARPTLHIHDKRPDRKQLSRSHNHVLWLHIAVLTQRASTERCLMLRIKIWLFKGKILVMPPTLLYIFFSMCLSRTQQCHWRAKIKTWLVNVIRNFQSGYTFVKLCEYIERKCVKILANIAYLDYIFRSKESSKTLKTQNEWKMVESDVVIVN